MGINLSNSLEIAQQQKLVMTVQLKQSLKILNMSRLELEEEIIKESEENPVLEIEKHEEEVDWEKFLKNLEKTTPIDRNEKAYNTDNEYDFENMVKSKTNLYDYLKEQVDFLNIKAEDKQKLYYIVECLDDDGYLRISDDDVIKDLKIDKNKYEHYLSIIHQFEPSGVGARNLAESLNIQLKNKGIKNELINSIVLEDLEEIGKNKIKEVAKKRGISVQQLVALVKIIKGLEPKPGIAFSNETSVYVEPDVYVRKIDGKYEVFLNETDSYQIGVSSYYKGILSSTEDKEAQQYVKDKLNSAFNLIRNIESRKNTILKIAKAIVVAQEEFFEKGDKYLKPMTMKSIADTVDFHESTISRGVNGKYLLAPSGLYELKYFFSAALETETNDMASSISVKSYIRDIIKNEDKRKPLSDNKIVSMLEDRGLNVARRTVAKYREEMDIPSSSKRREY